MGAASRLVSWFPPRVVVIAGGILLLGAMLYGSTLNRGIPYFPNMVMLIVVGAIGLGMINVPLGLSLIASVGVDRIGPTSAIALMLSGLGGPVVLAVIQAAITSRTLHLGGTSGPVKFMNAAQLHALDQGYTYGLLWLAGGSSCSAGWRCSSATPRSRWRARRKSRKPSTPGKCSSTLKSPAANPLRGPRRGDGPTSSDRDFGVAAPKTPILAVILGALADDACAL